MNINITLVVQAINFLIAYIIIRFLLFKPVVQELQQEWHEKDALNESIEKGKLAINDKIAIKDDNWRQCRNYFKKHAPKLDYVPAKLEDIPIRVELEISRAQRAALEAEVAELIVKEVERVG